MNICMGQRQLQSSGRMYIWICAPPRRLFQYQGDLQAEQVDHGIVDVSRHLPAQPSYTIYSVDISNIKSSARCAPWSKTILIVLPMLRYVICTLY